jgi:outer membrane lipoprotein LolB
MPRLSATLLLLAIAGLLSACVSTTGRPLPDFDAWPARQAHLETTDEWEFSGRIGISAGDEGLNGKFWWRQDGVVFRARISGPIGVGTIFINGDRRELTLTEQDGTVTELEDAEIDLRARYGWTIPVTSLRFWALGIPDPSSPAELRFNADGLADEIGQRDWLVTIDQYREGGGQPMPRRLTAVSGDFRVRLIIDEWAFR